MVHDKRRFGLVLTTALTSVALAGCSAADASPSTYSASASDSAVAKAAYSEAIVYAEDAVTADPRNASYRALAGSAYLDAGRFDAAATAYGEAIALGDNSARTALGHALAAIGAGRQDEALRTLSNWDGAMDAGDYGLALALAGRPAQGAHVLGNAIRDGQNTAKVRQNFAYAMALAGDWRTARVMAAEDVPADQLGDRLGEWSATAAPEFYQQRVAKLLGAPLVRDPGMPTRLALANFPEETRMAAAEEPVEIAPVAVVAEAPVKVAAVEAPASAPSGPRFVSNAVVQKLPQGYSAKPAPSARVAAAPAAKPAPRAKPRTSAPTQLAAGDHRIQLGSFLSADQAERAKGAYAKKYPQLDRDSFKVAKANVNGKTYYRVSAGGMAESSAERMCSSIKSSGGGCFAYAGSRKLPGTVDSNVRVASR
ncbi:SPOR domain-containing protein [Altererythrobacter sp. MF3-039]